MFHPTINLLLQISITSHPRAGDINPKQRMFPKSVYYSLSAQNNPQQANFLQPSQSTNSLSPQPTQPKECDPILYHIVPQDIPLLYTDPKQVRNEISHVEELRDANCNIKRSPHKSHWILHRNNTLQA